MMSSPNLSTGFLSEELGERSAAELRSYDPMFYHYVRASETSEATEQFLYLYKRLQTAEYVKTMEAKARSLLSYYRKNKNFINRLLVDRVIKRELYNICYENQFEDSDIVVEALRLLHEVFIIPHVNVLFYILWNFPGNLPTLSRVVCEDKRRRLSKIFSYVEFFLHHARIKRAVFGGHRMTDMFWEPMDYSVLRSGIMSNSLLTYDSETVLLLHRYGAKFTGQVVNSNGPMPPAFFGELGRIIFGFQSEDLWNSVTLELLVDAENVNAITRTMLKNFKTFVLSTRNPSATTHALAGTEFRRWRIPEIYYLVPFYDAFYPGLNFGRNSPSSLQHNCRYIIRERLNSNWELPYGIWKLPLPNLICRYLNFEFL